jgi:hypothetical protein
MKWQVRWLPSAEQELADAWLEAPDRTAVSNAALAIDQALVLDPENSGESRAHGRRIAFAPPLGVMFRPRPDQSTVEVLHVWRFVKH